MFFITPEVSFTLFCIVFIFLQAATRILVLVHFDLDGICASKILQVLCRSDHIRYTVVPVQTVTQLVEAFQEHAEQVIAQQAAS